MRLFIAVLFDPDAKAGLTNLIDDMRAQALDGRFSRPENLHLTLAFLGETPRVQAAQQAMAEITQTPFVLRFGELGQFRRGSGALYWIGMDESPALLALQSQLSARLTVAGFRMEDRAYHPHVTLGREVVPGPGWKDAAFVVPSLSIPVSKISLMKSEHKNGKLVYTEIHAIPL